MRAIRSADVVRALGRALRLAGAASALLVLGAPALAAQEHEMDGAPATMLHGFTDVDYVTGGNNTGRTSAFGLGQFDLYVNSRVTDRLTFLGETVFEYDEASSEFVVDVERVIAQYALAEHFRIDAGKVHTPLGYWNNAYHHGLVMQPTIARPQVVQFEDDGGPLPIHTVGVQLSGRDLSSAHLGFDLLLGNPLGNRPVSDARNGATAVAGAVHAQLTPALRVGVSGYRDRLVSGSETPSGDPLAVPLTQTIGGGFLAYFGQRAEGVIEGHDIVDRSAGTTASSPNWFAYAGARVAERVVPYVMHEDVRLADDDPYFTSDRFRRETLGVRYEQSAAAVLKLELHSLDRRGTDRATDAALQLALAF
jgi:hypothetical protein